MRTVTFVVVIAIHAVFFFLFAERWSPADRASEPQAPTILVFLPMPVSTRPVEPVVPSPLTPRAARPAAPKAPAPVRPEPKQQIPSSTPTPAPDWRAEAGIAANGVLEAEQRNRDRPSPLAPHDFSAVVPGSTDTSKPKFGWYYAGTHRVQGTPGGALIVNINDRCAVAFLFIFPFPVCKVGKMPAARSDLFEHMNEVPAAGEPNLP